MRRCRVYNGNMATTLLQHWRKCGDAGYTTSTCCLTTCEKGIEKKISRVNINLNLYLKISITHIKPFGTLPFIYTGEYITRRN